MERQPGRERRRGQKPVEQFIDPIGAVWNVDPHRRPFGDEDFYRILRRTNEQGKPEEMEITESWMIQLTKAREIHERRLREKNQTNGDNPPLTNGKFSRL